MPLPVLIEVCRHPAWATAAKHARPSETIWFHKTRASLFLRRLARDNKDLFVHWQAFGTILAPGLSAVLASFRIAKLLKALTGRRMI